MMADKLSLSAQGEKQGQKPLLQQAPLSCRYDEVQDFPSEAWVVPQLQGLAIAEVPCQYELASQRLE
jgi:hypothetical protein